jgi:hypothetical protein
VAKQLEQFKKDYGLIKHGVDEGQLKITKTKTDRGKLDQLLEEHAREIGRRVRALREHGHAGVDVDDFKDDAEITNLLAQTQTSLTANAITRKIIAAVAAGLTAQQHNDAEGLKKARQEATSELGRLDNLVNKHSQAYDGLGETVIMTNSEGPKIKEAVTKMRQMKVRAHQEFARLPH